MTLKQPYSFLIYTDGTDYYGSDGFQVVYGGPDDAGGVDGADAAAVIQACLDNLTAGRSVKEKVSIRGNITIDTTLLLYDYTELEICGKLKLANSSNCDMIQLDGDDHVLIHGGMLDGNKANNAGDYDLISAANLSDLQIRDMELAYSSGSGIEGYRVSKVRLINCYIHDNGETGTNIGYGARFNQGANNVIVCGCSFIDNYKTGLWVTNNGASDQVAQKVIIGNCYAKSNGMNGFYVSDNTWGQYATYVTISNCVSNDSAANDGFLIIRCQDVALSNLVAKGNAGDGIVVHDSRRVSVNNCVLRENTGRGLYTLMDAGHSNSRHTFTGIIAMDNGEAGIHLKGTTYSVVSGCWCYDSGASTQNYGIQESDSANVNLITNNQVSGNTVADISIVGAGTVCQFNKGFVTEKRGSSTGTGAEQTIAHGCAGTPDYVWLTDIEEGANAYQSSAADATNIYITAVNGKDYAWKAEYIP